MLIEWTLLCYGRYRKRRLRCHLAHYPDYLLRDMGLRMEGNRVVSDREETATPAPSTEPGTGAAVSAVADRDGVQTASSA
ncbi:MAG: hypothetical protein AAF460_13530 [Pseudomonadota bacterium]